MVCVRSVENALFARKEGFNKLLLRVSGNCICYYEEVEEEEIQWAFSLSLTRLGARRVSIQRC